MTAGVGGRRPGTPYRRATNGFYYKKKLQCTTKVLAFDLKKRWQPYPQPLLAFLAQY